MNHDELSMLVKRTDRFCPQSSLTEIRRVIVVLDSRLFEFVGGELKLAAVEVMEAVFVQSLSVLHCPNLLREEQR